MIPHKKGGPPAGGPPFYLTFPIHLVELLEVADLLPALLHVTSNYWLIHLIGYVLLLTNLREQKGSDPVSYTHLRGKSMKEKNEDKEIPVG